MGTGYDHDCDCPLHSESRIFALEGDKEKFLDAGMDDYISKPIKLGELKALLEKYQRNIRLNP
jgi:CheY-like chemotaxis protein